MPEQPRTHRRAFFQSPLRYNPAYLGNELTALSLAASECPGIRRPRPGCGSCLIEILELEIEENPMTRGLLSCLLVLTFGGPLHAAGDEPDDAYAWLEEVTGEKPLAWVKERDAESTGEFTRSDQFQALDRRLLEILDSDARIPMISKHGAFYYNFWRDARNTMPRSCWRRATLEEFRKAKPAWETVLDLDALAKEEKENWVWRGAQFLRPENKLVLISLSRGGADASVAREFDAAAKSFVKDGYALPEAKSQIGWARA